MPITSNPLSTLTPRELEVASQVYLGASNASGAKALGIERATFALHLQRVFKKLDVNNRASVVRIIAEDKAEELKGRRK